MALGGGNSLHADALAFQDQFVEHRCDVKAALDIGILGDHAHGTFHEVLSFAEPVQSGQSLLADGALLGRLADQAFAVQLHVGPLGMDRFETHRTGIQAARLERVQDRAQVRVQEQVAVADHQWVLGADGVDRHKAAARGTLGRAVQQDDLAGAVGQQVEDVLEVVPFRIRFADHKDKALLVGDALEALHHDLDHHATGDLSQRLGILVLGLREELRFVRDGDEDVDHAWPSSTCRIRLLMLS